MKESQGNLQEKLNSIFERSINQKVFQNSSKSMSSETDLEDILRERVVKAQDLLKVMSTENLKIATFFYQFALFIEEAHSIKKSLKDTILTGSQSSDGELILCGFPGTQEDAMDQVSESLIEMNSSFHSMSVTLKTKSQDLQKYPKPEDKTEVEKSLGDAQALINNLQMLKVVIENSTASMDKKYKKAITKINDTTLSLLKKSDPSDRQKKPINEYFPVVLDARKVTHSQKALLIQKANTAIENFKKDLQKFALFSQSRNDNFRELFDIAMYAYMKIAANIQNASGFIEEKAKKIDAISDLKAYSKIRGIVRYDLSIKPFEEFECDTSAFRGLVSKIYGNITQKFDPIGFVKVTHSFKAENPNEMNCVRGKRLLLLERMQGEWTFVMHPVTRVVGFVPTQCIEPIGKALGVVLRKQNNEIDESIMIRPGEYVAITNLKPFKFETMRGEKCNKAPANLIGVVFQDY